MLPVLPDPVWGVILLVLFGLFYWLNILATVRALMAFTGTILIAQAGFVGHALGDIATWLTTIGGTATGILFGVAVPAIAAIVALVIFVHDLMPKHSAGKRTGWAGIVLAALLVTGVSGISALNSIPSVVHSGVSTVTSIGSGG
jgi:hypothetical protein